MYKISYKASFIRLFDKLEVELQEEIIDTLSLLKEKCNHSKLRVHKLHGHLGNFWSCSVNYKIRIVFYFETKSEIVCSFVGDHDIYK